MCFNWVCTLFWHYLPWGKELVFLFST
jgi:hypothetical protein